MQSTLANSTTRQKIELNHGHFAWCSIGLHHATWHILDMKSLACMHTSLHKQSPWEHGNHHLRGVVGFGFRANSPQSDAALAVDSIHIQTNLPNQVHYYTNLINCIDLFRRWRKGRTREVFLSTALYIGTTLYPHASGFGHSPKSCVSVHQRIAA